MSCYLKATGYRLEMASTPEFRMGIADAAVLDSAILDIMIPGFSRVQICRIPEAGSKHAGKAHELLFNAAAAPLVINRCISSWSWTVSTRAREQTSQTLHPQAAVLTPSRFHAP